MRTNDRMTFVKTVSQRQYDPDSDEDDYVGGATENVVRPCLLMDLGMERSVKVFGDYRQGRKVAILDVPYTDTCDTVRIGEQSYKVVAVRQNRKAWYLEGGSHVD